MPFLDTPLLDKSFPGEIIEVRLTGCNPELISEDRFRRVTDGIDRYITGIGTALSGVKTLANGNDSSFDEAVLLDGEYWLDVNVPAQFSISNPTNHNRDIIVPATTWLFRKTSKLRFDPRFGNTIDASNMLAVAAFDRMALDDDESDDFKFIPEVQELFDINFNSYELVTRASNLVSTMRDRNHGNPPKAYLVAQYPSEQYPQI